MCGNRSILQEDPTKFCTGCDKDLPIDCFYLSRKNRDGRTKWCKECLKKYRKSQKKEK